MTEEENKVGVILPFLREAGFSEGDIRLESNFQIQLGRGVYNIKGEEIKRATGRSDLLCLVGKKPMFIIEVKIDSHDIQDADRRQGLTYARLHEPLVPYVLVSNGIQSKLYSTINGLEVNDSRDLPASPFKLDIDSEFAIRFDALKEFICYSKRNILTFCDLHNAAILDKLSSQLDEPIEAKLSKKYLSELYVNRNFLENEYQDFMTKSLSINSIDIEVGIYHF